jgi:hypothetical protein
MEIWNYAFDKQRGRDSALRCPRRMQRRNGLVKWFTNALCSARWTRAGTPQRGVPTTINSSIIPQLFVKGIIP